MSIRKLFLILSVAFAMVTMTTAVFFSVFTSQMTKTTATVAQAVESVRSAEELQNKLLIYNLDRPQLSEAGLKRREREIEHWLGESRRHISSEQEEYLVEALSQAIQKVFVASLENGERSREFRQALQLARDLTEMNVQSARQLAREVNAQNSMADILSLIFGIASILAFPLFWFGIRKGVYLPIEALSRKIDSFHLSHDRPVRLVDGPLEFRKIERSIDELIERLESQKGSQLRFLASVAHDLRNPLGAIRMSAEVLRDRSLSEEKRKSILDIITRQTGYLDQMVGDLLDSNRIESGHLELKKSRENLNLLVRDAISLHQHVSAIHRITLTGDEAETMWCDCDPLRISQVLNNLLNNAIKYSPNGGVVEVSLRSDRGMAILQVKDQGIGVPADDRKRIFEPFRRSKLTKMTIPGVGLGLSVCLKIVNAHGGSIDVDAPVEGGSVFTVRLPLNALELPKRQPTTIVKDAEL